jgi:hypothetical protein
MVLLPPSWPERRSQNKKGLPSFATAGLCCREKFRDGYATQRLLDLIDRENGAVTRA